MKKSKLRESALSPESDRKPIVEAGSERAQGSPQTDFPRETKQGSPEPSRKGGVGCETGGLHIS